MSAHRLDRRSFVAATSLAGFAATIGARPLGAQTPVATPVATDWTWTDVTDTTVSLPQPPQRIVAVIDVVAGLWDYGVRPVGIFGYSSAAYPDGDHISWGNAKPDELGFVGSIEQTIDIEGLVALQPDIIITKRYDNVVEDSIDSMTPDILTTIQKIAPVVILNQANDPATEIQRLADFASSLGFDTDTPAIAEQRESWTSKLAEVQTVAAAQPDLTVLFANFDPAEFYVAGPDAIGELALLAENGLVFANADSADAGEFWETLSVEAANTYPADVAYVDVYSSLLTLEDLQAQPSYGAMPAIVAGQIGEWLRDSPLTYEGQANFVEQVLVPLRTAQKVS